ncbi:MAG: hypothetical protein Q7J54_00070 [Candidatus Woesearchaeota archaeon]|nr:hypothetical protein [Candidatus Woesearchaeota archaeon]
MTDEKEKIKQPSSESLSPEQKIEFSPEGIKKTPEKIETSREEIITKESLKREISMMELDDNLKEEASQKAKEIQALGEEEKIEHLLEITKNKGIVFAVRAAQQMNDPYILDTFHDILVKNWSDYKQFLK